MGGCAAGEAPEGVAASLGRASAPHPAGPRRDLEPAVLSALSDCELAPLESFDLEGGGRLYRVTDVRDREGWLRVDVTAPSDGTPAYAAAAKLGPFGDPAMEKRLIERLNAHLDRIRALDGLKSRR